MASTSGFKRARVKSSSVQPIGDLLQSSEHKERYSFSFENRRIISSKFLDWTYFVGCRNMLFVDLLNSLGLEKLFSYKGFWCLEVIRAFYTTLEYQNRDRLLCAEVRGTKIVLSEDELANTLGLLQLESTDLCYTDHYNSLTPAFYDQACVYKTITGAEE